MTLGDAGGAEQFTFNELAGEGGHGRVHVRSVPGVWRVGGGAIGVLRGARRPYCVTSVEKTALDLALSTFEALIEAIESAVEAGVVATAEVMDAITKKAGKSFIHICHLSKDVVIDTNEKKCVVAVGHDPEEAFVDVRGQELKSL